MVPRISEPHHLAGVVVGLSMAIGAPLLGGWVGPFTAVLGLLFLISLAMGRPNVEAACTTWIGRLPFAFVVAVVGAVVVRLLTGPLTDRMAINPWVGWIVIVGCAGVAALRSEPTRFPKRDWPTAIVCTAVVLMTVTLAVGQGVPRWTSQVNGGTDFSRHVLSLVGGLLEGEQLSTGGYPRGVHVLTAQVVSLAGAPTAMDTWLLLQALTVLMLLLILAAILSVAARLGEALGLPPAVVAVGIPVAATAAFMLGILVPVWFRLGQVTSIGAVLALLSVLAVPWALPWARSDGLVAVSAVTTAYLANVWTILAPIGLALLLWGGLRIIANRRLAWRSAAITLVAAIAIVPVATGTIAPVVASGTDASLSATGNSELGWPEWYWYVAVLLAGMAAWAVRRTDNDYAVVWGVSMLSGAAVVAFTLWRTWDGLEAPAYYPSKTMWSVLQLVVPGAVAGAWFVVHRMFKSAFAIRTPVLRAAATAGAVGLLVVIFGGLMGHLAGDRSPLPTALIEGQNEPPLQLPAVAQFESRSTETWQGRPMVVWGLQPHGDVDTLLRGPGLVDWIAVESMVWHGSVKSSDARLASGLQTRDVSAVCSFLFDNPDAIRVTGPNPAAGPDWLIQAGCPADVVQPARWERVELAPDWYATPGSPLADIPVEDLPYPSPSELDAKLASLGIPTRSAALTDNEAGQPR